MKTKKASKAWNRSESAPKIFYYFLLFLAIALPLIVLPHILEDVFDLPKATLLRTVSLSIAGIWLTWVLYQGRIDWRKGPLDLPVIAFALTVTLATIFSYSTASSLFSASFKRHETFPTWLAYFLLFFSGSNFLRQPTRILGFLKAMVLTSMAVSVYGILQHFGYDIFSYQVSDVDRFRSFSTFGNAVFLGSYLVLIAPLALSLIFVEDNRKIKPVWLLALFLALVTLAFTYTRGAWVGGVLSLAAWTGLAIFKGHLFPRERKKWVLLLTVALLAAFLVIGLAEKLFPIDISLKERVVSAFELKGSVASRLSIWRTTLRAISSRPLLGWGPETQRLVSAPLREKFFVELEGPNKIADRPHNQLLHISYSFGSLGLFAYLWILTTFLFFSLSRLREAKELNFLISSGIIAAVLGYLIQEQFAFSVIGVTPFFWLLLGANGSLLQEPDDSSRSFLDSAILRYVGIGTVVFLVIFGVFLSLRLAAADSYYQKGIKASRAGAEYESLELFRRASLLNPWEAKYLFAYGERAKNVALSTRQPYFLDEAVSAYEKGLVRYPVDYDLYFGLGNVYFVKSFLNGKRDYSQARRAYTAALKFEPYFVEAYVWLGKSYLAEGDTQKALRNFQRAANLAPQNISALDGLAQAYERTGDTSRAVSYLKQILSIDPYYKPAVQELERLKKETSIR